MTNRFGPRSTPIHPLLLLLGLATAFLLAGPVPIGAQVLERLGRAAGREAEAEAHRQVRDAVRTAIRCAVGDAVCQERARREGRDVILVDEHGDPIATITSWSLAFGGRRWHGEAGRVIDDEVLFAIHLAEGDDLTLYLFLSEADEGETAAAAVVLAIGDDDRCRYPFEGATPFVVWLDRVDGERVAGEYEGTVRCIDESIPVRARGTFQLEPSG